LIVQWNLSNLSNLSDLSARGDFGLAKEHAFPDIDGRVAENTIASIAWHRALGDVGGARRA
jgi:hypothetical protein